MGIEGCFSAVFVPTCWPSTRLAKVAAANDLISMVADMVSSKRLESLEQRGTLAEGAGIEESRSNDGEMPQSEMKATAIFPPHLILS